MKRRMFIEVRGKTGEWSFDFYGDPKHLDEWRADGLEVYEHGYTIPFVIQQLGLTRLWCVACDVFAFRFDRLFRR